MRQEVIFFFLNQPFQWDHACNGYFRLPSPIGYWFEEVNSKLKVNATETEYEDEGEVDKYLENPDSDTDSVSSD
jgi:hypothetical protein